MQGRTRLPSTGCAAEGGESSEERRRLRSSAKVTLVAEKTLKGGTFATYTASGSVRRNLDQLGFDVTKTKGFGKKRHMLLGKKID